MFVVSRCELSIQELSSEEDEDSDESSEGLWSDESSEELSTDESDNKIHPPLRKKKKKKKGVTEEEVLTISFIPFNYLFSFIYYNNMFL